MAKPIRSLGKLVRFKLIFMKTENEGIPKLNKNAKKVLFLLQHLHCGTVSILSAATGIRTSSISRSLRELEKDGWVHCLGYAQADPREQLHGQWWIPSRKDTIKYGLWEYDLKSNVRPLTDQEAQKGRCIRFTKNRWLHRHWMKCAIFMARAAACMRKHNLPGVIFSENCLRHVYGWTGKPTLQNPEKVRPVLTSVPDFKIMVGSFALHVEVELSIKTKLEYQQIFDHRERDVYTLYVVPPNTTIGPLQETILAEYERKNKRHFACLFEHFENNILTLLNILLNLCRGENLQKVHFDGQSDDRFQS